MYSALLEAALTPRTPRVQPGRSLDWNPAGGQGFWNRALYRAASRVRNAPQVRARVRREVLGPSQIRSPPG
jgi:hypothetical protein